MMQSGRRSMRSAELPAGQSVVWQPGSAALLQRNASISLGTDIGEHFSRPCQVLIELELGKIMPLLLGRPGRT